jgi:hypothetical protein
MWRWRIIGATVTSLEKITDSLRKKETVTMAHLSATPHEFISTKI